jgi:hypothetical protein
MKRPGDMYTHVMRLCSPAKPFWRRHPRKGMRLCAFCGQPTGDPGGVCSYHSAGHKDDWARANRLMCDLLHRGITSSTPYEVDPLDQVSETPEYVDLPG